MKTPSSRPPRARPSILAALWVGALAAACNSPPDGAREWTAADHDQANNASGVQTSGVVAPGEEGALLISVTWRNNCARCHGLDGRGQVPEGRMLRSPDLTRPALRALEDELIANVIRKGRNKMPSFDLPPKVLDGLVAHIRELQKQRPQ